MTSNISFTYSICLSRSRTAALKGLEAPRDQSVTRPVVSMAHCITVYNLDTGSLPRLGMGNNCNLTTPGARSIHGAKERGFVTCVYAFGLDLLDVLYIKFGNENEPPPFV